MKPLVIFGLIKLFQKIIKGPPFQYSIKMNDRKNRSITDRIADYLVFPSMLNSKKGKNKGLLLSRPKDRVKLIILKAMKISESCCQRRRIHIACESYIRMKPLYRKLLKQ